MVSTLYKHMGQDPRLVGDVKHRLDDRYGGIRGRLDGLKRLELGHPWDGFF